MFTSFTLGGDNNNRHYCTLHQHRFVWSHSSYNRAIA